jgi:hypothetical protein
LLEELPLVPQTQSFGATAVTQTDPVVINDPAAALVSKPLVMLAET